MDDGFHLPRGGDPQSQMRFPHGCNKYHYKKSPYEARHGDKSPIGLTDISCGLVETA